MSKHAVTGRLIGWGFQYGSWLIPVRRLVNTDQVMAFAHPKPSFDDHLLVIPKRAISTFRDLISERFASYFVEILNAARALIEDPEWDIYSLGVNGGTYQDVRQVHFHLYRGQDYFRAFDGAIPEGAEENGIAMFPHPNPLRPIHQIVAFEHGTHISALTELLDRLIEAHDLIENGYTVFVQEKPLPDDCDLVLHVVSG